MPVKCIGADSTDHLVNTYATNQIRQTQKSGLPISYITAVLENPDDFSNPLKPLMLFQTPFRMCQYSLFHLISKLHLFFLMKRSHYNNTHMQYNFFRYSGNGIF